MKYDVVWKIKSSRKFVFDCEVAGNQGVYVIDYQYDKFLT